jgi:hypothetical protein
VDLARVGPLGESGCKDREESGSCEHHNDRDHPTLRVSNAGSSYGSVVFVDESAESVVTFDLADGRSIGCVGRFGWEEREC